MTEMSNMALTQAVVGLAWLNVFTMFIIIMLIQHKEDKR